MVWPCLKVIWFSKDNPTWHSERKSKRGRQKKRWKSISKRGQERTLPSQLGQLKTGHDRKGLFRIHLWLKFKYAEKIVSIYRFAHYLKSIQDIYT